MINKDRLIYLLNRAEEFLKSIELIYEMESRDKSQYAKMTAFSGYITFAQQLQFLVLDVIKDFPDAQFYTFDASKMNFAKSVYQTRKNIMDGILIESGKICAFLRAKLGEEHEEIQKVIKLIRLNLRSIVRSTPTNEKEIQEKIEDLLIGAGYVRGSDFDRETGRVKTGVKESIPDFVFNTLDFCIEAKIVKDKAGPKRVTEEINADIRSYGTTYSNIFFLVYDIGGQVSNVEHFKHNIVGKHVYLEVVKH